jgi:hypothetical protein
LKGRGGRRRRRLTKIIDLLPSANQLKLKKKKKKKKKKKEKEKEKNVFFIRKST